MCFLVVENKLISSFIQINNSFFYLWSQERTAELGVIAISQLVNQARTQKLGVEIMPGCGITKENITQILRTTHALEFHASASYEIEIAVHRNINCSMGTQDEKAFMVCQEKVAYMATVVKCHKMDGKLGDMPENKLDLHVKRMIALTKELGKSKRIIIQEVIPTPE